MKIRTIAINTFISFLYSKVIAVAGLLFVLPVALGIFEVLVVQNRPRI